MWTGQLRAARAAGQFARAISCHDTRRRRTSAHLDSHPSILSAQPRPCCCRNQPANSPLLDPTHAQGTKRPLLWPSATRWRLSCTSDSRHYVSARRHCRLLMSGWGVFALVLPLFLPFAPHCPVGLDTVLGGRPSSVMLGRYTSFAAGECSSTDIVAVLPQSFCGPQKQRRGPSLLKTRWLTRRTADKGLVPATTPVC